MPGAPLAEVFGWFSIGFSLLIIIVKLVKERSYNDAKPPVKVLVFANTLLEVAKETMGFATLGVRAAGLGGLESSGGPLGVFCGFYLPRLALHGAMWC